jgi:hypothetical protein
LFVEVWTEEEDEALRKLVEIHGTGNCKRVFLLCIFSWITKNILGTLIAQSLPERSGKQCRERFHNHLDKGIKKGDWTEEVGNLKIEI